MLRILIDNTEVDYLPGISIQLTYTNPLFSDKKINEVESYNFTLPATPKINNIYLNSNSVNSTSKQVKKKIKIYHSGILFISGVVHIEKKGHEAYSCYVQNEGTDFYKVATEASMLDLDLGKVELWTEAQDATLAAGDKINLWAAHMQEINSANSEDVAYRFPMVRGFYDSPIIEEQQVEDEGNNFVFWSAGMINGFLKGAFVKNDVVPKNTYANDKNWHNTISPCLRAEFVLQAIMELHGIDLADNELNEILEYAQLLFFSKKVKDQYLDLGTETVNVHGRDFELNDFVPNVSVWEFFEFLTEMFGAYYLVVDNEIRVSLAKNVLNFKAVDFTKFAHPKSNFKDSDAEAISVSYDLSKEEENLYNLNVVYSGNNEGWQYKPYEEAKIIKKPKVFKHLPMNSIFSRRYEFIETYTQFNDNYWPGEFEYVPLATFIINSPDVNNFDTLVVESDEFPEAGERANRFLAILFRGYHPTIRYDFNPSTGAFDPNTPIATNSYFPCNLEDTERFLDFPNPPLSPSYFSTKHIYLTEAETGEEKGVFNTYHKDYYELINGAREVDKELHLPAHKVKELSRFKQPKHTIDNPRGRFTGFVKEFKVSLFADRISSTTITYLFQV